MYVSPAVLRPSPPKSTAWSIMPFAPVDNNGTQFYYEDTGAPTGSSAYTTLVLIHGAVFHSGMWRTFPQAALQSLIALQLYTSP